MSEHNLIQSMTNEELRRELAERLGWYVRPFAFGFEAAIERDGRIFTVGCADSVNEAWEVAMLAEHGIPDWPSDDGAAFRLVRDVVDRLNSLEVRRWHTWTLSYALDGFMLVLDDEDDHTLIEYEATGETARALSVLAVEALRRLSDG